jgi:hypothetical protein
VVGFPLLLVPFAIYNMVAFLTPLDWTAAPYTFPLRSGITWGPSIGDAFIVFSLLMLMLEFIKSTRQGKSLVEHFLSLLLAAGAGAEFVMVKEAGTSLFMLLVAICVVDLLAGFAASLRRARRKVAAMEEPVVVAPAAPVTRVEPARVEPTRVEPARTDPVRVEPVHTDNPFATPAEPVRTEPVIKVDPVQKVAP